jgi:hypothetical protein
MLFVGIPIYGVALVEREEIREAVGMSGKFGGEFLELRL